MFFSFSCFNLFSVVDKHQRTFREIALWACVGKTLILIAGGPRERFWKMNAGEKTMKCPDARVGHTIRVLCRQSRNARAGEDVLCFLAETRTLPTFKLLVIGDDNRRLPFLDSRLCGNDKSSNIEPRLWSGIPSSFLSRPMKRMLCALPVVESEEKNTCGLLRPIGELAEVVMREHILCASSGTTWIPAWPSQRMPAAIASHARRSRTKEMHRNPQSVIEIAAGTAGSVVVLRV